MIMKCPIKIIILDPDGIKPPLEIEGNLKDADIVHHGGGTISIDSVTVIPDKAIRFNQEIKKGK